MGLLSPVVILLSSFGALVLLLSSEARVEYDWALFEDFNSRFSKRHSNTSEKMYRFKVFQESLARQKMLNEHELANGGSAVYGITKFSDLTPEEFKSTFCLEYTYLVFTPLFPPDLYLSGLHTSPGHSRENMDSKRGNGGDFSAVFDWRDKGVIGAIRNQQRCGSCWAFAVVETIESTFAVENNSKLWLTLSSQQLISCDYNPSSYLDGCKGGSIFEAFNTVKMRDMVLVQESAYPFISENGETYACKAGLPQTGLRLLDFLYIDNLPEDEMHSWLVKYGPLTTSVNAVSWQDYIGGIIQHHCTASTIDHAVQVVGYNMTGEVPYWIVRNTWGADWGEDGYIRLKFGGNMCGIADEVAAATKVERIS